MVDIARTSTDGHPSPMDRRRKIKQTKYRAPRGTDSATEPWRDVTTVSEEEGLESMDAPSTSPTLSRSRSRGQARKTQSGGGSSGPVVSTKLTRLPLDIVGYALDIFRKIMSLFKWPIALLLTIYLAWLLMLSTANRIRGAVQYQVRSGMCAVPFAASLVEVVVPGLCQGPAVDVDFTNILSMQEDALAALPEEAESFPSQLKRAEVATNDLKLLVQESELESKVPLVEALQSFSGHARQSSVHLQRTVVRVRGLIDTQLAMNEWALTALRKIDKKSTMLGAVIPFLGTYETRQSVTSTYLQAMDELADQVRRLMEVNEVTYENLGYLEEDLYRMRQITALEQQFQVSERDELLSSLWSMLGGNQKTKRFYRENLKILAEFERDRIVKRDIVAGTSIAFSKMMMQIEYMREQLRRPSLSPDHIPLEMHIRSIELGIEDMKGAREERRRATIRPEDEDLFMLH